MGTAPLTVHQLRSRWKPKKLVLLRLREDHATCIRLHRAFSWAGRCENGDDPDVSLIFLWIAFNCLYGQWDDSRREPVADRESWRGFLDRVLAIDGSKHIASMLTLERDLVIKILDDEYVSGFFWEDPSDLRASKSKKAKFDARTWYVEGKWRMILDRLMERIYLLRCQLMHGAATYDGKLNRQSLDQCVRMMQGLMNAVFLVVIDHGENEIGG